MMMHIMPNIIYLFIHLQQTCGFDFENLLDVDIYKAMYSSINKAMRSHQ